MSDDQQAMMVVLRFRDGHAQRCTLQGDFRPKDEDQIEAVTADGTEIVVPLTDLKAVFFLKNPRRRQLELDGPSQTPVGSAMAQVEFFDGEVIHGRVKDYSVANKGFFLYPTAPDSNNERIFVVASALTTLAIEG
jgi:hypothetical protein